MSDESSLWSQAVCSALQGLVQGKTFTTKSAMETAELAACMADIVVSEYDGRYSEYAMIMKGIPRCDFCKKETGDSVILTIGHRFCDMTCEGQFLLGVKVDDANLSPL